MTLEKGDPGSLEEWETVVGDDFSLYYDSYSVDERVDSDSKVRGSQPPSEPRSPRIQGSFSSLSDKVGFQGNLIPWNPESWFFSYAIPNT